MKKGFSSQFGAKHAIVIVAAVALIFGCVIGGTVAWLTAKTATIENTFTVGDIVLQLKETTGTLYELQAKDEAVDVAKDPKVTVKSGSVDCWVFVKIDESAGLSDILTYEVDEAWTQLKDATGADVKGVYYRQVVGDSQKDVAMSVLKGDKITQNASFTGDLSRDFYLNFTAYAVQLTEMETALEAWGAFN